MEIRGTTAGMLKRQSVSSPASPREAKRVKSRILLADGQEIIRFGLRKLFQGEKRYSVIADATNPESTLDLVMEYSPDLVICDITMSHVEEGIEVIGRIKNVCPTCRILVFTNTSTVGTFRQAMLSGADGFLLKKATTKEIIQATGRVLEGDRYFGPHISKILVEECLRSIESKHLRSISSASELSMREAQVLWYIAQGLTDKKIAARLFISFRTVHNHRTNIMKKRNIHTTAELVRYAVSIGLVEP